MKSDVEVASLHIKLLFLLLLLGCVCINCEFVAVTRQADKQTGVRLQDQFVSLTDENAEVRFALGIIGTRRQDSEMRDYCRDFRPMEDLNDCINKSRLTLYGQARDIILSFDAWTINTHGDYFYFVKSNHPWSDPNMRLMKLPIGIGSYGVNDIRAYWFGNYSASLRVGRYTSIAGMVDIHLETICPERVATTSFRLPTSSCSRGPVVIGNDVWIGARVVIMSGVTIGDGAVLGAHSVVEQDVPPYAIVIGNPAQFYGYRHSTDQIEKLMKIQWWNWNHNEVLSAAPWLMQSNLDLFLDRYFFKSLNTTMLSTDI